MTDTTPAPPPVSPDKDDKIIEFQKPVKPFVHQQMDKLRNEAQNWEQTAYRTANEMLYAILAKCYEFEQTFDSKNLYLLNEYCNQHNVAFTANTHALAKIVKCVFTADRRRVSTYVLALRSAKQHRVKSSDLVEWLKEQGGVQEISLKRSPNYKTASQRAELARENAFTPVLATVGGEQLVAKYDKGFGSEVLLVASYNSDNTFSIHRLIQKGGAINAALSSLYPATVAEMNQKKPEIEAVSIQEQRENAIEETKESFLKLGAA
jgi:hypothetical protein